MPLGSHAGFADDAWPGLTTAAHRFSLRRHNSLEPPACNDTDRLLRRPPGAGQRSLPPAWLHGRGARRGQTEGYLSGARGSWIGKNQKEQPTSAPSATLAALLTDCPEDSTSTMTSRPRPSNSKWQLAAPRRQSTRPSAPPWRSVAPSSARNGVPTASAPSLASRRPMRSGSTSIVLCASASAAVLALLKPA